MDFRGDPKPAFFAVARAFERRRVTLTVSRAVWAGEQAATVEAWLWAEDPVPLGSTVVLRARALDGTVVAEQELVAAAVGDPVPVGSLEVPVSDLDGVFLWEAEWRDADAVIDLERMIATATDDFAALFDVPAPVLSVSRDVDGTVLVRNIGGVAALTVRVVDARPVGAPDILSAGGDPRPLLPGESRRLRATPGIPVHVEAWNAAAADPGGTPRAFTTRSDRDGVIAP